MAEESLKQLTAKSVKWNIIDRLSTQILYAVTGIVLARELSQEAFGLVGAILVFQAFAMLFVDSGFSFALIQRKRPTESGYSTVLWFNLLTSILLYVILWVAAPLIADLFGGDTRLIALSRVMFLSFIINASAIVQTNRLAKQMNFKPIAIINVIGLSVGAIVGIWMACTGWEAWAIVWQTIAINAVKSSALWIYCRWRPLLILSLSELRGYFKVGSGMMMTSFLNVLFQNIYSFFVGNRVGIVPLGYYTQSDKWSKMGVTAVTQVLTSAFLPTLSEVQDDASRFRRVSSKMSRFTAYILFPSILFLMAMATPVFHTLFGQKWDPSITLFQLLLFRGIFTVLNTLYNNYMLALGKSQQIFRLELLRDTVAIIGIIVTLPYMSLSSAGSIVYGLEIMMWGQVSASFITWVATLAVTSRVTHIPASRFLLDLAPYALQAVVIAVIIYPLSLTAWPDWIILATQAIVAVALYLIANAILSSKIQSEVFSSLRGKRDNRQD